MVFLWFSSMILPRKASCVRFPEAALQLHSNAGCPSETLGEMRWKPDISRESHGESHTKTAMVNGGFSIAIAMTCSRNHHLVNLQIFDLSKSPEKTFNAIQTQFCRCSKLRCPLRPSRLWNSGTASSFDFAGAAVPQLR